MVEPEGDPEVAFSALSFFTCCSFSSLCAFSLVTLGQVMINPDVAVRDVKILVEYEWPDLRKSPMGCERFDGQV